MSYELAGRPQWPAGPRSCCGPYCGRMRALMVHLRAACQGPKWHSSAAESWCRKGMRRGGCALVDLRGTDGWSGGRHKWAGVARALAAECREKAERRKRNVQRPGQGRSGRPERGFGESRRRYKRRAMGSSAEPVVPCRSIPPGCQKGAKRLYRSSCRRMLQESAQNPPLAPPRSRDQELVRFVGRHGLVAIRHVMAELEVGGTAAYRRVAACIEAGLLDRLDLLCSEPGLLRATRAGLRYAGLGLPLAPASSGNVEHTIRCTTTAQLFAKRYGQRPGDHRARARSRRGDRGPPDR